MNIFFKFIFLKLNYLPPQISAMSTVANPIVKASPKLNSRNWYKFAGPVLESFTGSSNLTSYLRDSLMFELEHEKQFQDAVREKVRLEGRKIHQESVLDVKKKDFEKMRNDYVVYDFEVQETVRAQDPAVLNDMISYLPPLAANRWKILRAEFLGPEPPMTQDPMDQPHGIIRLSDIFAIGQEVFNLNQSILELRTRVSQAEDLCKHYSAVLAGGRNTFDREKGIFLAQLFSAGPDGLVEPEYLRFLEGNPTTWMELQRMKNAGKLVEAWDKFKQIQKDATGGDLVNDLILELLSLVPTDKEDLTAFDLRVEQLWKYIQEDGPTLVNQQLVITRYQKILKLYYQHPSIIHFMESFYLPNKTLPATLAEYRHELRIAINANREATGVYQNIEARPVAAHFVRAAVDIAAPATSQNAEHSSGTLNNSKSIQNKRSNSCFFCSGSKCKGEYCQNLTEEELSQLKAIRAKAKARPQNSKRRWPKKDKKPDVVASTEEDNEEFDCACPLTSAPECECLTDLVVSPAVARDSLVQLDNGANVHVLSDANFFKNEPTTATKEAKIIGLIGDAPMSMSKIGETVAFGPSYYNERTRNILSQSKLEDQGYTTSPIKNGNVTTAWKVARNGSSMKFIRQNGIFVARSKDVLDFANTCVVAVATRNNPTGMPNYSNQPTRFEVSREPPAPVEVESAIQEMRDDEAMDVEETPLDNTPLIPPLGEDSAATNSVTKIAVVPDEPMLVDIDLSTNANTTSEALGNAPSSSDDPSAKSVVISDDQYGRAIPTFVPSLNRHLRKDELEKSRIAAFLHRASGHAGKATEKAMIKGGHLAGCDLTEKDIDIYYELNPTCLGCLKGKMTLPPQTAWKIRTGAAVGEYWELDLGYFAGKVFMVMVDVVSNYTYVQSLTNRKEGAVIAGAIAWNNFILKYLRHLINPEISIKIKCDRESVFLVFAKVIKEVVLERAPAEGHAARVEVTIRIIKERARSVMYHLQYTLPSSRYVDLINFVVDIKNYLPATIGATHTPNAMVLNRKISQQDMSKIQFGQTVCAIIPPGQRHGKDQPVSQEGIIVGFETSNPSNLRIFIPDTSHVVTRCKVAPVDSPALVQKLNELSRQDPIFDPFPLSSTTSSELEPLVAAAAEGRCVDTLQRSAALDNMSAAQAIKNFGKPATLDALHAELQNMANMKVFEYVKPSDVPSDAIKMPSKVFFKAKFKDGKFEKLKARLVSRGDLQPMHSYGDTKSPTADKSSLFSICSLNKYIKGSIYSVDVPAAFLFANLKEKIYMSIPKDISDLVPMEKGMTKDKEGRLIVQIKKSLYGLKQAPLNWFYHLAEVLTKARFEGCIVDRCVFFRNDSDGITHIVFHVDDLFVSSNSPVHMKELKTALHQAFGQMEWSTNEFTFLGMHFKLKDDYSIDVDMVAYTKQILNKNYKQDFAHEFKKSRGEPNPSSENLFHELDKKPDAEHVSYFKSVTMELMYLTSVRLDVLKECVCLAMVSHSPGPLSWKLLRQVLHYLHEKPDLIVNFGTNDPTVTMYADAGYGMHPDASSHTGIFITLGDNGGPVLVKSKKQPLVTQSSTESELLALADGVKKAIPIAKLMAEMKMMTKFLIVAKQDNQSTMVIASHGEGMGGKAKHFLVRYHFLKQLIEIGKLALMYLNTEDMIPDFLTKPMVGKRYVAQVVRAMYHGDAAELKKAGSVASRRVGLT